MTNRPDLLQQLGALALGSRLKRLSDRLMRDVSKIYAEHELEFQARWFPVVFLLKDGAKLGVTEIAELLSMTHPAINQVANQLTKAGLLLSKKDSSDERRRILYLSKKGLSLVNQLEPLWDTIKLCNEELINKSVKNIFTTLNKIESALEKKEMYDRVKHALKLNQYRQIEIIPYTQELKKDFYRLNKEWLNKYFSMEPTDKLQLQNPEEEIINTGGQIYFARLQNNIIGTAALIKYDDTSAELAKMAVTEKYQSKQAGKKLAVSVIEHALRQNVKTILLFTSPKLERSVQLYTKLGFDRYQPKRSKYDYRRKTISMKLNLNKYRRYKTKEIPDEIRE